MEEKDQAVVPMQHKMECRQLLALMRWSVVVQRCFLTRRQLRLPERMLCWFDLERTQSPRQVVDEIVERSWLVQSKQWPWREWEGLQSFHWPGTPMRASALDPVHRNFQLWSVAAAAAAAAVD